MPVWVSPPGAPTITVSLTGLRFEFVLLGAFAGLDHKHVQGYAPIVTGEDLRKSES